MIMRGLRLATERMPAISSWHALARVSLVAATGGFLFGYDTAAINGANQLLTAHFHLNAAQEGRAGASAILGCIPGALLGGLVSDRVGRKRTLLLCALLFLISGVGSAIPATFAEFLSARFLGGLAIGIASTVCPLYVGECAPAATRGGLGTLFQLGIVIGIFLTLYLNDFIQGFGDLAWNSAYGWRWMLGSEALPACLLLGLLPGAPESPRWLLQRGREAEARETLAQWASRAAVESEVAEVRAVTPLAAGRHSDLLMARVRRPLIVALGLALVQQLSGINAILYYSTRIFTTAGVGISDAFTATVLVGLVNLIFTLVALIFMDRVGRRPLLLLGLTAQMLSLSAVAWLLGTHAHNPALLVAVLVFIASFAAALGPIPWLLGSEILPAVIRGRGMAAMALTVWVGCYVVAQTFPMLNDSPAIGPAKIFGIYAVVSGVGLLFTYWLIPETKERTLEEIEASWCAQRPKTQPLLTRRRQLP